MFGKHITCCTLKWHTVDCDVHFLIDVFFSLLDSHDRSRTQQLEAQSNDLHIENLILLEKTQCTQITDITFNITDIFSFRDCSISTEKQDIKPDVHHC